LGLLLVDSNLVQMDEWIAILIGLKLVAAGEKFKILDAWFSQHQKNEALQTLFKKTKKSKYFQFLIWTLEGREYLAAKREKNKSYAACRADFIAHLDFYKQLFLSGEDASAINDTLMIHFYYCENDYFLATEIALLQLEKKEVTIYTYWDFFKLLAYFYFQNGKFLKWKTRVLAWADKVWASNAKDYHKCFYQWIKGITLKHFNEPEASEKCFSETLTWGDAALKSSYERCILSSLHDYLAKVAIDKKDLATARFHLQIASQHDDYFTTECQIMLLEGKTQAAIDFLEKKVAERPITEEYWDLLAKIALDQNKPEKAIYYYTQSVQHSPQYRKHFVDLIELLEKYEYPDNQALIQKYTTAIQILDLTFDRLEKLAKN
jgi:hypothetical protein